MKVIVYTSADCSACRTVKEFLAMHHVDFEERSLGNPQFLEELGERYGAYSAPSVVVDNQLVEGGLPGVAEAVGIEL
ncbi:MAG TPA: glutaredoxin family protein [Terriglobales bacterium]|nr:glutaredoxin family protein [Terriglobales bacterium]